MRSLLGILGLGPDLCYDQCKVIGPFSDIFKLTALFSNCIRLLYIVKFETNYFNSCIKPFSGYLTQKCGEEVETGPR